MTGWVLSFVVAAARADEPETSEQRSSEEQSSVDSPSEAPPSEVPPSFPSEGDLFGNSSTTVDRTVETAPGIDPFEDVGIPTVTELSIAQTMGSTDDWFTVGGQMWFQFAGSVSEDQAVGDMALSSPSFADFYGDARPNDRVRGYIRARYRNDFTVASGATGAFGTPAVQQSIAVDQFWLKFDAWQKVFITVGKQRIRWGAGRFWNPTDFMQTQRLDGLAVFDVRLGVPLVKVHIPLEKTGTNLYALANIDAANTPGAIGGALRIEQVLGPAEFTASALFRKGRPLKLGADLSTGLGPVDFKIEAAITRGTEPNAPHWDGAFSASSAPSEAGWDDKWLPQVVFGAEYGFRYNDEDSLLLGAEYFHNEAGYADSSLYPWLLFNGQFTPFYLGRDYVGVYAFASNPGRLRNQSFTASYLGNLSDESSIVRGDWRLTANTFLNLNTYVAYHFGDNGEFHYGLEVPAIPTVPGLENGLSLKAAKVDVGAGFQLTF